MAQRGPPAMEAQLHARKGGAGVSKKKGPFLVFDPNTLSFLYQSFILIRGVPGPVFGNFRPWRPSTGPWTVTSRPRTKKRP